MQVRKLRGRERRVQQIFLVTPEFTQKFHNVVYIILSLDGFIYIIGGGHHMVLAHSLLHDFTLFHTCNKAVVNAKRHAVSVR